MRRFVFTFAAVSNLLFLDQAVKEAAVAWLKGAAPHVVVPGFFSLAYVENRGCAWGMLQGRVWALAVFAIAAMAFVAWKRKSIFPGGAVGFAAESFLYDGILGNLVDRLYRGYVVDMFDFMWGSSHFPCFNVADVCINVAVGLLLLASFLSGKNSKGKTSDAVS